MMRIVGVIWRATRAGTNEVRCAAHGAVLNKSLIKLKRRVGTFFQRLVRIAQVSATLGDRRRCATTRGRRASKSSARIYFR